MTIHFQRLLREKADDPLLSGKGDDVTDGLYYLVKGFDGFLARAAKALAANAVHRHTVMKLFVNHALEVLNTSPGVPPAAMQRNAEQVLQYALTPHSDFDDSAKAA
jgi:hypothetical protein